MKTVYFGTPEFAVQCLDAIMHSQHEVVAVVTAPDRPVGRGQKVASSPVKQYALAHGLPLLQPERLKAPEFIETLRALQADAFVVVAFRMLPEAVWAMPPHGTFNVHASLLPRYRGAAPINWAIINGETRTGITTFQLNPRIDEGLVLMQEAVEISPDETAGDLHDRLAALGSRLAVATLDGIENHTLTPQPQQGIPCLAPKLFKETCRIDLHQPAHAVVNHVRGLAPSPTATLLLRKPSGEDVPFKVFRCRATTEPSPAPGTLVCDGKKVLKIGATDYFVEILELQMAGKKRNTIEEFLRGNHITGWKTA